MSVGARLIARDLMPLGSARNSLDGLARTFLCVRPEDPGHAGP
jgi:hypothetical protein